MNKSDLDKIAVAIIEKYGTEKGTELLTTLLQELNKPAEVRTVHETQPVYYPYPLTGYPSYLAPTQPIEWDKVTCSDNQQKSVG